MDLNKLRVGVRLIVAHPDAGYQHDGEMARRHLGKGATYSVDAFRIEGWHTYIWLKEVPGVAFNSVHFEVAE